MRDGCRRRGSVALAGPLALTAVFGMVGCGGATASALLSDGGGVDDARPDASADAPGQVDQGPAPDTSPPKDVVVPMEVAPPPIDTGPPDTGPTLPPISCGGTTCSVPEGDCCFAPNEGGGDGTYSCQVPADATGCSGDGNTPIECAGSADCPGGEICCGTLNTEDSGYVIVECTTSCNPEEGQILFCGPGSTTDEASCTALGGTCGMSELLPGFTVCQGA